MNTLSKYLNHKLHIVLVNVIIRHISDKVKLNNVLNHVILVISHN